MMTTASAGCSQSSNNGKNPTTASVHAHSVALIDQLAVNYPNPGFVMNISRAVRAAGYSFDYYPPEATTVDFFANLPSRNYSMIILRTHGTTPLTVDGAIVTSERYSDSAHLTAQLTDKVESIDVNGTQYFGLRPSFISDIMCTRFQGTIVLSMFCGGAMMSTAKAFIDKGASEYVGWNGGVTLGHTDLVFQSLVTLLEHGLSLDHAVENVMATFGPDPHYGSPLVAYSPASFSSSAPHSAPAWWDQYWMVISGGIVLVIVGLFMTRNRKIVKTNN